MRQPSAGGRRLLRRGAGRRLLGVCALVAAGALGGGTARADDCVACHQKETPGVVSVWQGSAHGREAVACAACHGTDHEAMKAGRAQVGVGRCRPCHTEIVDQHLRSRHGLSLHSGWGCTRGMPDRKPQECSSCHQPGSAAPVSAAQCSRFLKQTADMQNAGCNRCHQVERSCSVCHTAHGTDRAVVQSPRVCAKCHMGPDHPQWEAWSTSQHGTLFLATAGRSGASCQQCHMPAGTHDVSQGLTMDPGGVIFPPKPRRRAREAMLAICARCHSRGFSRRSLAQADAIRKQSRALVKQAREIIEGLADRRLLAPMPKDRPPHPQLGHSLVLDGRMLYEDISHIERLFFKMKKFDLQKTIKGAFHFNPGWTHWYGNAELKMDLVDIRSEARRLIGQAEKRIDPPRPDTNPTTGHVERALRALRRKFERGALTPEAYAQERATLLKSVAPRPVPSRPPTSPGPTPN